MKIFRRTKVYQKVFKIFVMDFFGCKCWTIVMTNRSANGYLLFGSRKCRLFRQLFESFWDVWINYMTNICSFIPSFY